MAQHGTKKDPTLTLYITTVDYNRRDPVFWIQAKTNMTKYKHKQRRFPRYYSELQKLERHLISTLDDVLLPVLPFCPQPHQDKDGSLVPRQWWLNVHATSTSGHDRNYSKSTNDTWHQQGISSLQEQYLSTTPSSSTRSISNETTQLKNDGIDMDHSRITAWDTHIQVWLNRITCHPRATLNEGLREFVESEVGFRPQLKPMQRHKKISGFSIMEPDLELTQRLDQLDEFGQQLLTVEQNIQVQIATQAIYSDFWLDLASGWVAYGGRERDPLLFILYKGISKGCQQLANMERSQEFLLAETFFSQIQYQIRNVQAAKSSLHRRVNAFTDYLTSRKHTESCLRHVDRLKSSSNIDRSRVNDVIDDLELARLEEQAQYQRYGRIDNNLGYDLDVRYKRSVTKDMIAAIREYARGQLHLEKQKLDIWQSMQQHLA
ncbi:hypothetical protein BC941DRAFT_417462 [Chlamydoabsidia padenii]|nr:hypothetical protein BC941DRAFT_417462 [Chlamydoabsidia padenii]